MGNYAVVNGLKIYYEIHGAGAPLVLLHGGVGGIEMFGANMPALSATRKVVAVDLQGHGHTADIDRPLRFERMADDVAAIKSPVMIAFADADAVHLEHIMEFFTLLGGGKQDAGLDGSGRPVARLAILPGTTHYDLLSTPALAALVTPFLDAPLQ